MRDWRKILSIVALLVGVCLILATAHSPSTAGLKGGISTPEFARLVSRLSEPEGYFDTNNIISNEAGYLKIIPLLKRMGIHDGVYLGVGPDQNYSYIAELHPRLALIVDIRRRNMLQHLYFKALFQLCSSREDFLQRLFGRRVAAASSQTIGLDFSLLLDRLEKAPLDAGLSDQTDKAVLQIIRAWSLDLQPDDLRTIEAVARDFRDGGPELQFTSFDRRPRPWYPTYRTLLLETDSAGSHANYLASDEKFRAVQEIHRENRIIPVVADLAGNRAMAQIARELHVRHLKVSCFYVSNVEFYLFEHVRWRRYVLNMQALPWAADGVIIRSFSNGWRTHPAYLPGYYMTTLLQRAASFFEAETAARNTTYWDLVTNDYIAP